MLRCLRTVSICFVFLLFPAGAFAQGQLGALTGSIMDPSGALVPEAQVTITNMDTGVKWEAKSSTAGYYRVSIPPGRYQVAARKEGFKAAVATNIAVPVAQVVTIDLKLQMGSTAQSITVSTEAPLLTPSTAEVGGAMSPEEYSEIPVFINDGGRQPDTFVWNSMPGTTPDWYPGSYSSISGGQGSAQTVLIDGVTIGRFDWGSDLGEQNPGMDAISEFKLQSANYSAEFGTTGGGVESFSIKSGTNQFHGSVFEVNNNPLFNANGWENNATGGTKSDDKENNFGATLGGPIRKNKTFFFFDYEGDRKAIFTEGGLQSAPTASMLQGDFSAWLLASNPVANPGVLPGQVNYNSTPTQVGTDALGRPVDEWEIFDPTTTRVVAAGGTDPVTGLPNNTANSAIIRDPFPNNVIPKGEFSSATATLLGKFPTTGFVNGNLVNNLPYAGGTCCPTMNRNAYTVKIDEVINDKHKLSGTFMDAVRHRTMGTGEDTWFPWYTGFPVVHEKTESVGGPQARILYTWTVNDHSVNTLSLGYNRFGDGNNQTPDAPYGVAMGIPGVYAPSACFPEMKLANSDQMGTLSTVGYPACPSRDPTESYSYQDSYAFTHGKHSWKFGAQYLRYRYDTYEPGAQGGAFNFSNIQTELPSFHLNTGAAFASWILGAANNGSAQEFTTEPGYRAGVFSFFAQDDWRVSPRLTLNLGVRWEIPQPRTEAFNRMAEFDPTAPDVMPSGTILPGALVWLGNCSTCIHRSSFQDWYFRDWAPRLGLAYQINSKTVFRGGYGISYQPPIENGWGPQTFFGYNQGYQRFRQAGQLAVENPILYLTNFTGGPAPGPLGLAGVNQPVLPNMNPEGMNGYAPDFMPGHSLDMPLVQTWSAGFQYELPHKVLLEANYVGTRGTRLFNKSFGGDWNQANSKYMGLGDMLVDDFQGDLSNPATAAILQQYGITKLPYPTFESDQAYNTTIAAGLAPLPQYGGLTNDQSSLGMSIYHSLQVLARKNTAHGLTFIAAYTLSKDITDSDSAMYNSPSGIQDFYNRKLERSIAQFDYPQALKLTWIYSLPLGSGHKWLNSGGVVNRVFGGWQLSANQRYGSGDPLSLWDADASPIITPYVRPDVVAGVKQTLPLHGLDAINGTPYLNEAAFADPPLSPNNSFPLRVGTAPRYLPNIRGPAHQEEDFSLIKDTNITERLKFQIRGDFQNVFNRVGRGDPDTGVNDGTFGLIFGPMNGPRLIQMTAHLIF